MCERVKKHLVCSFTHRMIHTKYFILNFQQIMVDESLVKEEMVETLDSSQSEGMDTGMQYGHVGSDTGMDGAGSQDDHSSHMIANKYDQPVLPGQTQPLADAVAEALAGPSGMQGVRISDFKF